MSLEHWDISWNIYTQTGKGGVCALATAREIVSKHLSALWKSDWDALNQSLSRSPELILAAIEKSDVKWNIGTLYRHITQAWDFLPGEVHLSGYADGTVIAEMSLTNGHGWIKNVRGEYTVNEGRVCRIRLADSKAHRISGNSGNSADRLR